MLPQATTVHHANSLIFNWRLEILQQKNEIVNLQATKDIP